jgi:hypothetical protein
MDSVHVWFLSYSVKVRLHRWNLSNMLECVLQRIPAMHIFLGYDEGKGKDKP